MPAFIAVHAEPTITRHHNLNCIYYLRNIRTQRQNLVLFHQRAQFYDAIFQTGIPPLPSHACLKVPSLAVFVKIVNNLGRP